LLMSGRIEFTQRWGQRRLEDNWRRQIKNLVFQETTSTTDQSVSDSTATATTDDRFNEIKNNILKKLPKTTIEKQQAVERKALAYFQLGKVYKLFLLENEKAKKSFLKQMELAPVLDQSAESLYYLALIDENNEQYNQWKTELNTKYPSSFFTRKINRGKDGLSQADEAVAEAEYSTAYILYTKQSYAASILKCKEALKSFPGSSYEDRFEFLNILNLSKMKEKDLYSQALETFIKSQSTSNLLPLAKEMKEAVSSIKTTKE
jgi:tetratricopeptide (TPR) repeat protein